ncbi:endonuclease/exonuclease/phosphatase family protein [Nanoarchaeota archaeon]
MSKKKVNRRSFLGYTGIAALAATSGCYRISLKDMNMDCYHAAKLEEKVRVMSYNIANARGNYDEFWKMRSRDAILFNLGQIGAMSQSEDIELLCMNEVDFDSTRTHYIDQAEHIAKHLCYNHVIKESLFKAPGIIDVGNAVVSKYPLTLNYNRQYGTTYAQRIKHIFKTFMDFDVEYRPGKKLNIVLTHLDHHSQGNRKEEVAILLNYLKTKKRPFVLLGDFNSGPGSPAFDRIVGSGLVKNPKAGIPTFRSHKPKDSLDHILASDPLRIENYHTIWAEMSDHRPVVGDIVIP